MKIQRINDNVIKCIMSGEEMSIRGIDIQDIMEDHKKAEEFLRFVLTKAKNEVDFVTNGDVLNVQLSVLNDGGVSLMISDDHNMAIKAIAAQFKERLREFSKALDSAKKLEEVLDAGSDAYSKDKVIRYFISTPEDENEDVSYRFWSRLANLKECVEMAKALKDIKNAKSDLYKYFDEYYFCIELNMTKGKIAKCVFLMSEYADDVSAEEREFLMVREHGNLVIKDNALEKLNCL